MAEINSQLLESLSESDKKSISQFIEAENTRTKIQTNVHTFTDLCFKKCITAPVTDHGLTTTEASCMNNCVNRYLDANVQVVQFIASAAGNRRL
ncbi:mitochondrial import inner membrane translocase subunit TIM8 [Lipomyces japonicus]|uniref:mitochondrial import inner membrane translocase subunit TIM8 n=1 Tax=Lipomyces japonicus TaxID=56871 RepID=UPI0034CDD14E